MTPEPASARRVGEARASELFGETLAAAASGEFPGFTWLDGGGLERSFVGLEPDRVIEGDELGLLEEVQAEWRREPERVWMGWLSYELGVDTLLTRSRSPRRLPGLSMRRFSTTRALTPVAGGWLEGEHGAALPRGGAVGRDGRHGPAPAPSTTGKWPLGRMRAMISADQYRARVHAALEHIAAGEVYQVNLSHGFHADWLEVSSPLAERVARVYSRLRATTPAEMGALIRVDPSTWFISNSPETLLEVRLNGGHPIACSRPIKGTRARAVDSAGDAGAIHELSASAKELAEHVMIVDLVRNDLGRLAVPGSVRAPARPQVVTLPTVHHLVSEVACELPADWSLVDLVRAVFPGGSVTGAPKRRTVELIDALEGEERGIYCGAILLLEPGGLRVSIPIRTGIASEAGLDLRSGGGIVIDSDPAAELLETWTKVRAFDRPGET